jgi:hypothetical protein
MNYDARVNITRLQALKPGELYIYYRGDLQHARMSDQDVDRLAMAAWTLSEQGRVHLLQRRLSPPVVQHTIISMIDGRFEHHDGSVDWRYGVSKEGFAYIAIGCDVSGRIDHGRPATYSRGSLST